MNQVLKAAMAINAQVLSEMEIPESYIESLPKVYIQIKNIATSEIFKIVLYIWLVIFYMF